MPKNSDLATYVNDSLDAVKTYVRTKPTRQPLQPHTGSCRCRNCKS